MGEEMDPRTSIFISTWPGLRKVPEFSGTQPPAAPLLGLLKEQCKAARRGDLSKQASPTKAHLASKRNGRIVANYVFQLG